jgi:hypothetical protein
MGVMGEDRVTPSGWLPPIAPGPRPRLRPEPPAPAPPPPARASNTAVWALALSITGLALLIVSLGTLFLVTLPCSIGGWVLAVRANGHGRAAAALWIARIGVIAGVAAFVIFVALLAGGFDFEQFRDDMQRELRERRERPSGGVRASIEGLLAAVGR